MDNTIYKILETIGEVIQWTCNFYDDNYMQIKWFIIGIASLLIVQYIL